MKLDIEPKNIREQVNRIINSPQFKSSSILSEFLNFIVSETLEGHDDLLKEYVIATQVLKKETDFNPQSSAIVRIHARRLRGHLEVYYSDIGSGDPIRISIPKGRYIPVFEINDHHDVKNSKRNQKANFNLNSKPVVAILPLKYFDDNQRIKVIGSVLCEYLTIEFAHFDEMGVISNYSALAASNKFNDPREIGAHLGAEYLITGSCFQIGQKLKITFELNSLPNNQIIWTDSYYIEDFQNDTLNNYGTIIRKVVSSTCGHFGSIYRNSLNHHIPEDYDHLYAVYWSNHYHQYFSKDALQESMKAIETGLENNPDNALLYSLKGELYLNLKVMGVQGDHDYLKKGMHLISKALDIDPNCQHAYMSLAWANLLNHDKEKFLRSVNKLISINPNNVAYSGSAGFGYICAGEYAEGMKYMVEATQLNPYYPWYLNFGFCLYYFYIKEYKEALYWAELINRKGFIWDPLMKTSICSLLGHKKEAREEADRLLELFPDFPNRAKIIVDTFLLDEALKKSILKGLLLTEINISDYTHQL